MTGCGCSVHWSPFTLRQTCRTSSYTSAATKLEPSWKTALWFATVECSASSVLFSVGLTGMGALTASQSPCLRTNVMVCCESVSPLLKRTPASFPSLSLAK